jgi:hypothetical protein
LQTTGPQSLKKNEWQKKKFSYSRPQASHRPRKAPMQPGRFPQYIWRSPDRARGRKAYTYEFTCPCLSGMIMMIVASFVCVVCLWLCVLPAISTHDSAGPAWPLKRALRSPPSCGGPFSLGWSKRWVEAAGCLRRPWQRGRRTSTNNTRKPDKPPRLCTSEKSSTLRQSCKSAVYHIDCEPPKRATKKTNQKSQNRG